MNELQILLEEGKRIVTFMWWTNIGLLSCAIGYITIEFLEHQDKKK